MQNKYANGWPKWRLVENETVGKTKHSADYVYRPNYKWEKIMKIIIVLLCFVFASYSWAEEFMLHDTDCKLLGPDQTRIKVFDGLNSEYLCSVIGKEATCIYRDIKTKKPHGEPTKFEVLKLEGFQIWASYSGNIKMLVDEIGKSFIYGMTTIFSAQRTLVCKQCVGIIVRHEK